MDQLNTANVFGIYVHIIPLIFFDKTVAFGFQQSFYLVPSRFNPIMLYMNNTEGVFIEI
jgi:hypothetical protein